MPRLLPSACLLLALGLAGCATTGRPVPPADAPAEVVVDGTNVLGSWIAVGALDEPDVDADLRNGMLIERLVVNPRGRVQLTGEDRRAGTGLVTYHGLVSGDQVSFEGLPGSARLDVRGDGRIVLTDPRGNRTVYERE